MKKIIAVWGGIIALCFSIAYGVTKMYLQPMEFMSLKQVCHRWGERPLDAEKFKASDKDRDIRAEMACSLLKNQNKYIGRDSLEIKKIFGDYSGYFFSEAFPTYLINKVEKGDRNVWQILFFVDGEHKVSEIVVHKNCCY